MTDTMNILQTLHAVLEGLRENRARLDRGPKQVAAHEINVRKITSVLEAEEEAKKQVIMLVDRKQLDLKSSENKISDLKAKLNACSSNKEYQALIDQIAAAEMANSVLEDEILEGLDKIELGLVKVEKAKKNVEAAKSELEKVRNRVSQESSVTQENITRLEEELAIVEKQLPTDIKPEYKRVVKAKGSDALAPAEDGVCTGCGQKYTINMQSELLSGKFILCKSCGRLIYLVQAA